MITKEQIEILAAQAVEQTNVFVVEAIVKPGNNIVVSIDSAKGINIKDCVKVSRFIEGSLDREVEDFGLEVTSAGLDRPFKVMQQYQIHIGKEVKVLCKDGISFKGILQTANEALVEVLSKQKDKKTKKVTEQVNTILMINIKETKLIINI